ncbi:MAG: MmcB family DNA repair protein [Sphingomonadales bacterium]
MPASPATAPERDWSADALCRGIARYFAARGFASLPEFKLGNGRRADLAAIDRAGTIVLVEIKTNVQDWRGDRKWPSYLEFCDRFYFAVPPDFPRAPLAASIAQPQRTGLLIADEYGAALAREAALVKLNAARRRAETLRFARKAAARLHASLDPGFVQSWRA